MSAALLVIAAADASVFGEIVMRFTAQNSNVLLFLCNWSSLLLLVSKYICNTASRSESGVYSKIMATGTGWIGTMRHSIGKIPFRNMFINVVLTSSGTAVWSKTPK